MGAGATWLMEATGLILSPADPSLCMAGATGARNESRRQAKPDVWCK